MYYVTKNYTFHLKYSSCLCKFGAKGMKARVSLLSSTDPFHANIQNLSRYPRIHKKVTHKDYQTRQWPMLQPFPARTEKLERHIVLEKGFRKIQKTTCDFNIHFKKSSKICSFKIYHMVFCSSPLENLSRIHNNFSQTISNQYRTCAYSWM